MRKHMRCGHMHEKKHMLFACVYLFTKGVLSVYAALCCFIKGHGLLIKSTLIFIALYVNDNYKVSLLFHRLIHDVLSLLSSDRNVSNQI